MSILSAVGISKRYDSAAGSVSVLNGLNFELNAGDRVAIVGASGAGKSTLLNVLGGLDRAHQGRYFWAIRTSRASTSEPCVTGETRTLVSFFSFIT